MINHLPPTVKRKVIKIYLDAFVRQPVPCPTCADHCCQGCYNAQGYFMSSFGWLNKEKADKHISEMKEKYGWTDRSKDPFWTKTWKDEDQGFFVAGKGCRIPYKERSNLCVSFSCAKMTKEQRDFGYAINKEINSAKPLMG